MQLIYFLRNYKKEIYTTIVAIILNILAFLCAKKPNVLLALTIFINFVSLVVIIYFRSRERDFHYVSFTRREHKDDWIGKGIFQYERLEKCFSITAADPGYIYSKSLSWSDYSLSFEFKIVNECIGVIVRAVNLSNYAMLQITQNGIRPHIRINGAWYVRECNEVGLCFDQQLSLDKWYKGSLICEKGTVRVLLFDKKKEIFNRSWEIFRGSMAFKFGETEKDPKPLKIYFPVNLEYGSIGFRNDGSEKALIKNLLIKKT